ncbi:hypothetical protein HPP92_029166 [Vanilla planifolia]|uniref:Uncharacterized protein n=1 Tax=Vanilla planifolia TaxID=51239 RepID=A0A835P858_VANPL|nr:hypothetical protein HPP92_029166 [Vanilla planifolia]KAG0445798.1 hypothetical protein HPP92_029155 [Vanilla planifolia]
MAVLLRNAEWITNCMDSTLVVEGSVREWTNRGMIVTCLKVYPGHCGMNLPSLL